MTKRQSRRAFLASMAAGGGAVATVAASAFPSPAIAQNQPALNWRLTSTFPRSLEIMQNSAELFADYVSEATDGKFKITLLPEDKAPAPLDATDAVTKGKIEIAYTTSSLLWGKDPTFAIGTGLPFGLNARQTNAWMYEGGGIELMNEFYAKFNLFGIPAGNSGCQMGGWWRQELTKLDDLKGKKLRIEGIAGAIIGKLGVEPVTMVGADIFAALKDGKIDGAEWAAPYDDEKLGLYRAAKQYYYPGWWKSGPLCHAFINKAKWDILPKSYQSVLRLAGQSVNDMTLARYDVKNPASLKRLLRKGVLLHPFPKDIMDAAFAASEKFYADTAAGNAGFKKIFDNWKQFRADQYLWSQVAELGMDAYQAGAVNKQ